MQLDQNGLFSQLSDSNNILLAGAGGGFDIYSGVPLYFALRRRNKNVHLANLSFASLRDADSKVVDYCFRVTKETKGSDSYFPERTLCRWLEQSEQIDASVYAFPQCGIVPLRNAYQHLVDTLQLDTIVLVDGGTDSLMRGDESGLGTPTEDISSLVAVQGTSVAKKFLTCIGFGVDRFHGVCHAQFLEAVSDLAQKNAFLGTFSVLPQMEEAQKYLALVNYSMQETPLRPSIVNTSIASAIEGHFGDYHKTGRTRGSKLWISPLMAMYWSFHLEAVVQRNLYAGLLEGTEELYQVTEVIREFRERTPHRTWQPIPD